MNRYFKVEEITEEEFEEATGIVEDTYCQTVVESDNCVFVAVDTDEVEMNVSLDMFD